MVSSSSSSLAWSSSTLLVSRLFFSFLLLFHLLLVIESSSSSSAAAAAAATTQQRNYPSCSSSLSSWRISSSSSPRVATTTNTAAAAFIGMVPVSTPRQNQQHSHRSGSIRSCQQHWIRPPTFRRRSHAVVTTSRLQQAKQKIQDSDNNSKNRRRKSRNNPSRVMDEDGPTPEIPYEEPTVVNIEDIPELQYDENQHQIPHQPWRRGDMGGCQDPITVEWRKEAQSIMERAVQMVGGKILDVTWYLTQVVVTLDDSYLPNVDRYENGPPIDIQEPIDQVLYYDPNDPNPEPIWVDDEASSTASNDDDDDEYDDDDVDDPRQQQKQPKPNNKNNDDNIVYRRDEEAEKQFKRSMYARKDVDDPPDEPDYPDEEGDDEDQPSLYMSEETRQDVALRYIEEVQARFEQEEKPVDIDALKIDTAALSTIAKAILDALELVEDELQILSRHELILTSPGASDVLETQRQFDAFRGFDVIVETQDPFQSNRVLTGKLLERNAMDLLINKKGRMVTIPLNFVKRVRLPPAKREKGVPRDVPF